MKKLFLALIVLLPIAGYAGDFVIDSHTISPGGTISSGGNFGLTGTIGQPDAGKLSGGNFTLDGGFLSGVVLVQTENAPQLSIQLNGGTAIISWSTVGSTGYILEESVNLTSPSPWNTSGSAIITSGSTKNATVPASGIKFYRLRKP